MTKNTLWIDDPLNILFDLNKIHLIIPDRSDSVNEQVNSFTRFIMLYGALLSVYKKSWDPLVLTVVMSVVVLMLMMFNKKQVPQQQQQQQQQAPNEELVPTRVTSENPFGNPEVGSTDMSSVQQNPNNSKVSDALFVENLPMDDWDIYGKNNSQRQFFTLPPNDQTSFAEWLYNPGEVCKTNTTRCTGY